MRLQQRECSDRSRPGVPHLRAHRQLAVGAARSVADLRLTVSAGPTSVTVDRGPIRVEWDMGTETKSCYDAGRAWKKGMTDAAKTTCSYAYERSRDPTGDTHEVSAQIVYGVTWTCSGACLSPSGRSRRGRRPVG